MCDIPIRINLSNNYLNMNVSQLKMLEENISHGIIINSNSNPTRKINSEGEIKYANGNRIVWFRNENDPKSGFTFDYYADLRFSILHHFTETEKSAVIRKHLGSYLGVTKALWTD